MNTQISFSNEEKKEGSSTPKFRINKSINSIGKEENILDTLKQNIHKLINIELISNGSNEKKNNNEFQNENFNKNFFLNSLLNKINNKNELNDYYNNQFSFDGKSENIIVSKNEKDNNKENIDNNIIIIDNNTDDNNINKKNINNNEIKEINDINSSLISLNSISNENSDNNFNYILPLESDKSLEQFNIISFQGLSDSIEDKKMIKINKITNQKKMAGDKINNSNPEIINKKKGIGYLSKQNKNIIQKNITEEIKLTPEKNNNYMNIISRPDINFIHIHKLSKTNYNS